MEEAVKRKLAPPAEGLLPIRTVSSLTGVNSVTIRAWERRYGLDHSTTHTQRPQTLYSNRM